MKTKSSREEITITGYSKMYHDLDNVEKCVFVHGVQHVKKKKKKKQKQKHIWSDSENFCPFLLYFDFWSC